ncbi:MAG: anthranilate phosphoribosyltransferase [Planctomycetales bacterium]|nr:anthranilate phosphoribosyltransferase [Planctomycetales bacterium]
MTHPILQQLSDGEPLDMESMRSVIHEVMEGAWEDASLAELLTLLHKKGETAEEIAGAAAALRAHMTRIPVDRDDLIDTCGTGGDGSGTFNISTAAALVAAAAGAVVAKHGNRKITSKTGSADVLLELGVNIEASPEQVVRCIEEVGIGFCFAPSLHPAMKRVGAVRRNLPFPTIFNLLGPLSNPASAPYQLLGVGRPELRIRLAEALRLLGARRAAVVCGADGMDEVTLEGETQVSLVADGEVSDLTWLPEDFGVSPGADDSLLANDPAESAAVIRRVLEGEHSAARNIVVLNAGAALWTAGLAASTQAAGARAAEAIDSGKARELLATLAQVSAS